MRLMPHEQMREAGSVPGGDSPAPLGGEREAGVPGAGQLAGFCSPGSALHNISPLISTSAIASAASQRRALAAGRWSWGGGGWWAAQRVPALRDLPRLEMPGLVWGRGSRWSSPGRVQSFGVPVCHPAAAPRGPVAPGVLCPCRRQ